MKEQAQQLLKVLMENAPPQPSDTKPPIVVFVVDQLTLQLNFGQLRASSSASE